ncbi:MAG: hypothetical protein LKE59_10480 [Eubacterium sp.]|nr:hypothetical protein [Eubacterium sp.]MCH4078577.1 hypothetical protein [Eubacterium sp.]MCH4109718.1 hypothetical protein [Eubacterium sp.]
MGIALFVLQEIPYMIMPLIKLASNPIMNMQNETKWLEITQGIIGTCSMILLMLIVRDDVGCFSISTMREKIFFTATLAMLLMNYIGWAFYYTGHLYRWLIVICQFAAVPLLYLFYALWKKNYPLACSAALFFIVHTTNGYVNFIGYAS